MIFGIFRKIKRLIFFGIIISIIIIGYILSNIFTDSFQFDKSILDNFDSGDVAAVNDFIDRFKGSQDVNKVKVLLNSLILQAENFASTHTSLPTVHFNYEDILIGKVNFDAEYVFDYPDSLEDYINTLKNMLNSLKNDGSYEINLSNDNGSMNEVFITGKTKE